MEGTRKVYADLQAAVTLAAPEVADVIFGAATDGTSQLRYVGGTDIVPLLRARRESSETEYLATMRNRYAPKP